MMNTDLTGIASERTRGQHQLNISFNAITWRLLSRFCCQHFAQRNKANTAFAEGFFLKEILQKLPTVKLSQLKNIFTGFTVIFSSMVFCLSGIIQTDSRNTTWIIPGSFTWRSKFSCLKYRLSPELFHQ